MVVAGIDYSMTSPAVCVHVGEDWSDDWVRMHGLSSRKSSIGVHLGGRVVVDEFPEFVGNEQRFNALAEWTTRVLRFYGCRRVCIEGYSFGSKGQVYQIGENGGVLRNALWKQGVSFETAPPSSLKKAAGRGNLTKIGMEEAFRTMTGIDLPNVLGLKKRDASPSSDMIDAYFACRVAHFVKTDAKN